MSIIFSFNLCQNYVRQKCVIDFLAPVPVNMIQANIVFKVNHHNKTFEESIVLCYETGEENNVKSERVFLIETETYKDILSLL